MVRLTDRPDITLDVYRGRKTIQQQQQPCGENKTSVLLCRLSICSTHMVRRTFSFDFIINIASNHFRKPLRNARALQIWAILSQLYGILVFSCQDAVGKMNMALAMFP